MVPTAILFMRFNRPVPRVFFCNSAMNRGCLGYLIAHPHDWIQGSHGLLENHSDFRAAQAAHFFFRQMKQIAS
jgi:hypothetical protein